MSLTLVAAAGAAGAAFAATEGLNFLIFITDDDDMATYKATDYPK